MAKNKASCTNKKEKYKRRWGNQFSQAFSDYEIESIADELWGWFQDSQNFWLKDFANQKMIHRNRIAEFAQKNEYFKWIYEMCLEMQESKIIRLGMDRANNPALPVLMLKNNHNWTDRTETTLQKAEGVVFVE